MDKLIKARETISSIDREMALLFEKRMEAVRSVAEYKKEQGLPVYDRLREAELISDCMKYISDSEIRKYYLPFVKNTLDISKNYQRVFLKVKHPGYKIITLFEGDADREYDIVIGSGAIRMISEIFRTKGKVLIVTDSGVPEKYAQKVAAQFQTSFIYKFSQGEKNKTLDTCEKIYQKLSELSFNRNDAIIAVGGGVVGDVAGFVASTYMRGISFCNIPTTLLSQVDSSIGGKTAVNLGNIKNTVGSFYHPDKVIIDPDVLSTLDARQIKNGLAESLKMAITFSKELFDILKSDDCALHLEKIIELSLLIKKGVVEEDEKESSYRKSLNFGHTIGHAIEAISDGMLYHGECVGLGIPFMCGDGIRQEVVSVIEKLGLPAECSYDRDLLRKALVHDKKSSGEKITVVKSDEIGSFFFEELTVEEIINLI